jgi:hypothetical protein
MRLDPSGHERAMAVAKIKTDHPSFKKLKEDWK